MICPKCGSRNVEYCSLPEKRLHMAECLDCLFQWIPSYNPFPKEVNNNMQVQKTLKLGN